MADAQTQTGRGAVTRTGRPTIEGPVTGGTHGWPFGRPMFDLADHGYVEEEWFLEGEACTYRQVPGTEWGRDGRWSAEPGPTHPYRTRIIVYRPADPARFNGTALVCWNNVTAGYELFGGESPGILEGGYAFVGASVQKVGIHGFPANPQGLSAWDPERYGSLSIPTDDISYDIFTQVAGAVGPDRVADGPDPLGGLEVRHVVAVGASQSAGRLGTYVNAIHPLTGAFDGYLLQIYFGSGSPLQVGDDVINIVSPATPIDARTALTGRNLIRDDLDVPVMIVNSELEAIACVGVRQDDTDRLRWWESAGTCHVSVQSMAVRAPRYEREFGTPLPVAPTMNRISIQPLYDAATDHMRRWIEDGTPPPVQPRIEFAGDPPEVVRDEHGIARGGIRLPQADVPVAHNSAIPVAPDIFSVLYGSSRPFGRDEVLALYGDEEAYLARFEEAARRSLEAGVIRAGDVPRLVAEARDEWARAVATA